MGQDIEAAEVLCSSSKEQLMSRKVGQVDHLEAMPVTFKRGQDGLKTSRITVDDANPRTCSRERARDLATNAAGGPCNNHAFVGEAKIKT
jgi:hypothetical protein